MAVDPTADRHGLFIPGEDVGVGEASIATASKHGWIERTGHRLKLHCGRERKEYCHRSADLWLDAHNAEEREMATPDLRARLKMRSQVVTCGQ